MDQDKLNQSDALIRKYDYVKELTTLINGGDFDFEFITRRIDWSSKVDVDNFLNALAQIDSKKWTHYPGSNYTGPGTPVVRNIAYHLLPQSYTDTVALLHDIDYLISNGESPYSSDRTAIRKTDNSLEGIAMNIGLSLKTLLPFYKGNNTFSKLDKEQTKFVGNLLYQYIHNDENFSKALSDHGLFNSNRLQQINNEQPLTSQGDGLVKKSVLS